jgi:Domain of unknown function (DUF5348)
MEIVGTLRTNDLDKWEIVDDEGRVCVLSSGSVCEVQIAGHWIRTRLEYCHGWPLVAPRDRPRHPHEHPRTGAACGANHEHRGHYYAVTRGVRLCEGLPARLSS